MTHLTTELTKSQSSPPCRQNSWRSVIRLSLGSRRQVSGDGAARRVVCLGFTAPQVSTDGASWREVWWPGWTPVEARYASRVVLRSARPVYPTPAARLHTTRISLALLWTAPLLPAVHAITIAFPALMLLSAVLHRHRLGRGLLTAWLSVLSAADLILFVADIAGGDDPLQASTLLLGLE